MTLNSKEASDRGQIGGRAISEKKAASSAENGKRGGRPILIDEFTCLPISRQAKAKRRKKKRESLK